MPVFRANVTQQHPLMQKSSIARWMQFITVWLKISNPESCLLSKIIDLRGNGHELAEKGKKDIRKKSMVFQGNWADTKQTRTNIYRSISQAFECYGIFLQWKQICAYDVCDPQISRQSVCFTWALGMYFDPLVSRVWNRRSETMKWN